MPINYEQIMGLKTIGQEFSYGDREAMLYALGVGFGMDDPLDADELRYVYENDQRTVPTLATVIAWGAGGLGASGINFMMVVHGEQRLTLHRPLPTAADIIADSKVVGAYDKGPGKGAVILTQTDIRLKAGDPLCTLVSTIFARGDGGFGGPSEGAPAPHNLPDRAPDAVCELRTRSDQALLYRLSGDRNPLHSDPNFAKMAGFPKPILHGLCTYGTACRAVLKTMCGYDHTRLKAFDVRFSSPVFPGETIVTEMWKDGETVSFRSKVKERDAIVLNNGRAIVTG